MNHKQMVNAYITLMRLSGASMPIRTAHELYCLRKKLEPAYQFCSEREQLIAEQYHGRIVNGRLSFEDESDMLHAQAELQELYALQSDEPFNAVSLNLNDIGDVSISVNDIESLEGFVVLT